MENEATNTISTEPKNNFGGIIGAIIIIVLIVAGGWYFIGNRVEKIQDQKQLIDRIRGKEVVVSIENESQNDFILEIEDPIEKSVEKENDFDLDDVVKAFNNVFKETIEPITNIDKTIDECIKRAQGKMF